MTETYPCQSNIEKACSGIKKKSSNSLSPAKCPAAQRKNRYLEITTFIMIVLSLMLLSKISRGRFNYEDKVTGILPLYFSQERENCTSGERKRF